MYHFVTAFILFTTTPGVLGVNQQQDVKSLEDHSSPSDMGRFDPKDVDGRSTRNDTDSKRGAPIVYRIADPLYNHLMTMHASIVKEEHPTEPEVEKHSDGINKLLMNTAPAEVGKGEAVDSSKWPHDLRGKRLIVETYESHTDTVMSDGTAHLWVMIVLGAVIILFFFLIGAILVSNPDCFGSDQVPLKGESGMATPQSRRSMDEKLQLGPRPQNLVASAGSVGQEASPPQIGPLSYAGAPKDKQPDHKQYSGESTPGQNQSSFVPSSFSGASTPTRSSAVPAPFTGIALCPSLCVPLDNRLRVILSNEVNGEAQSTVIKVRSAASKAHDELFQVRVEELSSSKEPGIYIEKLDGTEIAHLSTKDVHMGGDYTALTFYRSWGALFGSLQLSSDGRKYIAVRGKAPMLTFIGQYESHRIRVDTDKGVKAASVAPGSKNTEMSVEVEAGHDLGLIILSVLGIDKMRRASRPPTVSQTASSSS